MKSIGILRRVDELGRVVIPIDIRTQLGIKERDALEVYIENSAIVLKKHEKKCVFCESANNLTDYKNQPICKKCLNNISKMNNENHQS